MKPARLFLYSVDVTYQVWPHSRGDVCHRAVADPSILPQSPPSMLDRLTATLVDGEMMCSLRSN